MNSEMRDCVVIGGGPAGSTFAALVKKYNPQQQVTVLEQARFPRYHIGESTIPAANNVFRELGVMETLERSSFVKKMGIVFVWGEDRQPWSADYLRLRDLRESDGASDVIDVTGQDFRGVIDRLGYLDTPVTAFNVVRAEFDQMLLNQARAFGADVREGTRATTILRNATGQIEGVRWADDRGRSGTILTPFVLDASGLHSLMTQGEREYDPHMNNFAVYGYLADADWKVTFNGSRQRSTVFICTIDQGWIWYFPIQQDVMSVGVVTRRDYFQTQLRDTDLESFWWDSLRSCPEVADLIKRARLRTDILPNGKRVAASQDWSSWARQSTGAGWAAAGDAAIFVDPILSSGVTLAMQSAHRAAYTHLTALARPDLAPTALWNAYATYISGEYGAFLKMARYFYGNNKAASSWWWEAQRVVNGAGRLKLDNHQAFTMATAGFFPTPRTQTPDTVSSLLTHLGGAKADLWQIFQDSGVPANDMLARCSYTVLTPFHLELRTEPPATDTPSGQLLIYHDLVAKHPNFAHRLAAVPYRIAPGLAPLVDAMQHDQDVASLLDQAPTLLPPQAAPDALRHATLDVVRIAAMKGFIQLVPPA